MNMNKLITFAAVAASAAIPMSASAEALSMSIAVAGYTGTTTLKNFQALVQLCDGKGTFQYSQCAANDGSDLWFTDSDGNVIPHEIDAWDASADSFVWVRLPEVVPVVSGGSPTTFTMHWGDLSAKQTASENVWKNYNDGKGGFAGVWHMGTASGSANEPDATGNGFDGVPTAISNGDLSQMVPGDGVVGKARVNQTSTANGNGLALPDYSSALADKSKFTISGWWSATALGSEFYPRFFEMPNRIDVCAYGRLGYAYLQNIQINLANLANTAVDNFQSPGFVHLAFVFDGTVQNLYSNGKKNSMVGDRTITPVTSHVDFMLGGKKGANRGWIGRYDEFRIYDGAQSADRIKADYDTVASASVFLLFGGSGIASKTLTEDEDWTGLDNAVLAGGAVIDLNGHNLAVAELSGNGMITNSASGTASRLCVSNDSAVVNTTVAIGGNIVLVKDGDGALTSSTALSYTGGTMVRKGTIQAPQSTAAYDAAFTPFGIGKITVNSNATFNAQSTVAYTNAVILNGGTVKGGAGDGGKRPIVMLERVTAPSSINQSSAAIEIGAEGVPVDLGGNTLAISIASDTYFRWNGSLANTTGKLVVTGSSGYLQDMPEASGSVDMDVSTYINLTHAVRVRDFRVSNVNTSAGTGAYYGIYVSGTYTPVGNYYYGCILQDGAVLNLSERSGCFTAASSLSDGRLPSNITNARKTVQFPDLGTVTVKLAGRTDLDAIANSDSNYIVKWSGHYGRPATTTFKLDDETKEKFTLRPDATGLKLEKKKGLMIIVK
ncbi:MAG: DUF2341 domain-containing protein [Kiritimatiellae bacterium]|nr:DUF2341 domain-containing protein [Kiritimatiellia bacterium]